MDEVFTAPTCIIHIRNSGIWPICLGCLYIHIQYAVFLRRTYTYLYMYVYAGCLKLTKPYSDIGMAHPAVLVCPVALRWEIGTSCAWPGVQDCFQLCRTACTCTSHIQVTWQLLYTISHWSCNIYWCWMGQYVIWYTALYVHVQCTSRTYHEIQWLSVIYSHAVV